MNYQSLLRLGSLVGRVRVGGKGSLGKMRSGDTDEGKGGLGVRDLVRKNEA